MRHTWSADAENVRNDVQVSTVTVFKEITENIENIIKKWDHQK